VSHIARVQRAPRSKEAPNKKRPRLLRAMGRPNSPPPELLKHKVLCCHPDVNPTLVPTGWHETAILPVHRLQTYGFAFPQSGKLPRSASCSQRLRSPQLSSAAVSACEQLVLAVMADPSSSESPFSSKLVGAKACCNCADPCTSHPQEALEISHNATWIQQIQPVSLLELHVRAVGWQHFPGHQFLNLPAQSIVRSGRETL